ncbi:MAG: transposase [Acetobacteraceae bacterium]|nr:MAG: transposase [Acetobacteraceae bacterium]
MDGMWTKEHRARQAAFERRRRYPTDLTDEKWATVQPLLLPPAGRGRPPSADIREMLNAIRTLTHTGCGWRMLPVHFGRFCCVFCSLAGLWPS